MDREGRQTAAGKRPDTPRWVKGLALAGAVLVVLVIVVMLLAGGEHGPGRHGGWVDSSRASLTAVLA